MLPPFNFGASQYRWTNFIQRWGVAAVLRRLSGDRPCWGLITDYNGIERLGKAYNPTDRRIYVAALARDGSGILMAPDAEQDTFVPLIPSSNPPAFDRPWRLYAPVGLIAPGDIPIAWDLRVRRGNN